MTCNWCNPSGPLTGKRCRECQRVYDLHLAAESGDDAEATRWIWEHAEQLRCEYRAGVYQRAQDNRRLDTIPLVDTAGLRRDLQGDG